MDPDKTFFIDIDDLQPSQLYISRERLDKVLRNHNFGDPEDLEPLPVKELDGATVLIDGHTRALAAYMKGFRQIRVYYDENEMDREAYRICVNWCKSDRLVVVSDLSDQILDHADYEKLWLDRCLKMQKTLEKHARVSSS